MPVQDSIVTEYGLCKPLRRVTVELSAVCSVLEKQGICAMHLAGMHSRLQVLLVWTELVTVLDCPSSWTVRLKARAPLNIVDAMRIPAKSAADRR